MQTMSMEYACGHLAEIVGRLAPGVEVMLTQGEETVAIIKAPPISSRKPPRLGTLKGTILYIAPDFDNIPEGFEEYLP